MTRHTSRLTLTTSRLLGALAAFTVAGWAGATVASTAATPLFASPSGAGTACSATAPCSLPTAIGRAPAGQTVLVAAGTYTLASTLVIDKAITVKGRDGRPSLVGGAAATADTVSASGGAVLTNLDIQTSAAGTSALTLQGATGENLTLSAAAGDSLGEAVLIKTSATPSALQTALALSAAAHGSAIAIRDGAAAGTASLLDVTAVSTDPSGVALTSGLSSGSATVENAVLQGPAGDVAVGSGTANLTVSHSDFRTSSGSVTDGGGNLTAAPRFAGAGDYHEAAGSPTIGAGIADPAMADEDLDGNGWATPPDMGAYQYGGVPLPTGDGSADGNAPATTPAQTGTTPSGNTIGRTNGQGDGAGHVAKLAAPTAPVPGVSVTLHPASGRVLVELPHTSTEIPLSRAAQLPVGTVIDTTAGSVAMTSAVTNTGATKTGIFRGGAFTVMQTRGARPVTTLKLAGGSFTRACTVHASFLAGVYAPFRAAGVPPAHPSHRVVRQLWGRDRGGRFVTTGRGASAAVRGTVWLTQDRCDGTLVTVAQGHVLVHDKRRDRNVLVSAGHAYLARVGG